MGQQKNIPALRFPEFEGEWEKIRLGEIISFLPGYAFDSKGMSTIPSKYQLIKMSSVYQNELRLDRNSSFWLNLEEEHKRFLLQCGDSILTMTGTVGKRDYGYSVLITESDKYLLNQRLVRLREKKDESLNSFINYLISTERFLNQFFLSSKGGTGNQSNVGIDDVKDIRLRTPSLFEQAKIASFLTAIDDRLQALKKKKALLEQYQKGIMQKIFSQELRFKDDNGKKFPVWDEKRLGDIYSFKTTNSYSRENLNYDYGDVKNIHYGDIHTKFHSHFRISNEHVPFINPTISLSKIAYDNYCKRGDIVFADASEDLTDVGKCIELIELNGQKIVAGLHTLLARPDLSVMALGFGSFLMKSFSVRNQIMKIAQGSKVSSISTTRLCNVKLCIPSKKEQSKIANFLSAIDNKIDQCQTQVEKTEKYKKGLLQQMFC